jgi:hypothetical protein
MSLLNIMVVRGAEVRGWGIWRRSNYRTVVEGDMATGIDLDKHCFTPLP